jgi:hypothetical protein
MDEFRRHIVKESGVEEIFKIYNVYPENRPASDNLTLFIGFENSGKRELVKRLNGTNSMAFDLIDDFSENVMQKMANAITLSKVMDAVESQSNHIKLIIVYKCADLDHPQRSIQHLVSRLYYFLRDNAEFYKGGVGLLMDERACEEQVESIMSIFFVKNYFLRLSLVYTHLSDQLHLFLNEHVSFRRLFARDFHLHTFQLMQGTFQEYRKYVEKSYLDVLNKLTNRLLMRVDVTMPSKLHIERLEQNLDNFAHISYELNIYGEINIFSLRLVRLKIYDVLTVNKIKKTLTAFKLLLKKLEKISTSLDDVRILYVLNYSLENYNKEFLIDPLMLSASQCKPCNATLTKTAQDLLQYIKVMKEVNYSTIQDRVQKLPNFTGIKQQFVMEKMTSLADNLERTVEKFVCDEVLTHLGNYLDGFTRNLTNRPVLKENVYHMIENWREKSKNLTIPKETRFRKQPIVEWYTDLFRPSSNDTWLENLTYYETVLCDIYEYDEIDPKKSAFYRQDLNEDTLNRTIMKEFGSDDFYEKRVNDLYESLRTNITIAVIKTMMVNSTIRVDKVIRNLNPVVTSVIIERYFEEVRDTEQGIKQQKRILAKQHHAVVGFKEFLHSFEHFFKFLDVPLPAAEWDELMAVQAGFDNVTDLSSDSGIVEKTTIHNWGRELAAAREVLYDLTSGAPTTSSYIKHVAKWTTTRVTDMQRLVVNSDWVIRRETTNTLFYGFIVLLYFVAWKIMK